MERTFCVTMAKLKKYYYGEEEKERSRICNSKNPYFSQKKPLKLVLLNFKSISYIDFLHSRCIEIVFNFCKILIEAKHAYQQKRRGFFIRSLLDNAQSHIVKCIQQILGKIECILLKYRLCCLHPSSCN